MNLCNSVFSIEEERFVIMDERQEIENTNNLIFHGRNYLTV